MPLVIALALLAPSLLDLALALIALRALALLALLGHAGWRVLKPGGVVVAWPKIIMTPSLDHVAKPFREPARIPHDKTCTARVNLQQPLQPIYNLADGHSSQLALA